MSPEKNVRLSTDDFRRCLNEWFSQKKFKNVVFKENLHPEKDLTGDYIVVYEAIFEPVSLNQARCEVWLDSEGYVAIGLETRERIARRLGLKYRSKQFAAGHEPKEISPKGLIALLEVIANGEISIAARGWFWLWTTTAVITSDRKTELQSEGYTDFGWLSSPRILWGGKIIHFKAWD